MPKTQKYVEVNNDGEWTHALVVGESDAHNLRLSFWVGSDRQEISSKEGTDPGEWREPA